MLNLLVERSMLTTAVVVLFLGIVGNVTAAPLVLACSNSSVQCGQPMIEPTSSRVVGGRETKIGAWPWMVSLVELGSHECGGAIISERFILTAAHCLSDESNDPNRWQVVAAKHDLRKIEPRQKAVKVKQLILHEEYDEKSIGNDVALLELVEPLGFTQYIQPICLPTSDQGVSEGDICLLAGWGYTRGTGNPDLLNQAILPVIADTDCALPDWYGELFLPNTTFCAGYEVGGTDACTGDSGGSLICKRGDKWFTQGIASWGLLCAEAEWPGIYTDVSKYSDWIDRKIAENSYCNAAIIG